ncbi:MAG: hypothetical protein H6704_11110 [Myxococcales bacterium]|nr:hypothetical protein [Myxococcales bacterium]
MRALVPLALVLALAAPTRAQLALGSAPAQQALVSLESGKFATAREQAEKVLDDDASDFLATYVLASVHFRAEGNLARALFLMRKSIDLLTGQYGGVPPTDERARNWHKRLLHELQWLLGEMDRRQDQLDVIAEHDQYYRPPREVYRIWPLLKLGRFDEARAIGNRLILSDDVDIRERAYNGLMAIEDEARNRKASYDWGVRGFENTRGESCIIASNLALAARRVFRFDEAERYDQKALKTKDGSCPTSPYAQLAVVYLIEGKFQQSIAALQALRKIPRPADLRVQNEMMIKGRLVETLHALGQVEQAETRVRQIMEAPDRAGMTSASAENLQLANALLFETVLTTRIHQEAERAAVRDLWDSVDHRVTARTLMGARWENRRLALRLSAQGTLLLDMVRPYYTDVMPWYSGGLTEMLGEGLIEQVIEEARANEPDYDGIANHWLDAMEAELRWRSDQLPRARALAEDALAKLPKDDALLRLRVTAILADILRQQGQLEAARPHYHAVLTAWPTVLRLIDAPLPVSITHDNSAVAKEAAERLGDSPRILAQPSPFTVFLGSLDDGAEACLEGPGGQRYNCVQVTKKDLEDPDIVPEGTPLPLALCDRFHDVVLAPKVELTQSDLTSLDGRPVRLDADKALEGILGEKP